VASSAGSIGLAFARSTGCLMRATFRMDITDELYRQVTKLRLKPPGENLRAVRESSSPRRPSRLPASARRAAAANDVRSMAQIDLHPHDDPHLYRFCPPCGRSPERRLLNATEPERLVCIRSGSVFYTDPNVA